MDKKELETKVAGLLGEEILEFTKIKREGGDSDVYEVGAKSGDYIFRTGGVRNNYDVEHEILKRVREKGVLAPKPIAASEDFSLSRKIQGTSLASVKKSKWPSILRQVGNQLDLVHSVKLDGFGSINPKRYRTTGGLVGVSDSWFEHIMGSFNRRIDEVKKKLQKESIKGKNVRLSKKQKTQVVEIVSRIEEIVKTARKFKTLLAVSRGSLLHCDIHSEHILVDKEKLVGLIDFNKCYSGDPFFDIAYFSVMTHGDLYPYLLKGSSLEFEEEKFHIYRLLLSVGKIHTRYVRHNYLHKYPKILDIAMEELEYFKR